MQEMSIYGVSFDLVGKQPIVLLKTADGNKFLPIWIGHPEAAAILMKLQSQAPPRPMTHDLVADMLEQRLASMHYALRGIDSRFDDDTYAAVLAFQKVHGLARTGRVDLALWQRIASAATPPARYRGDHVEVDKARQVLFEVRRGKVVLVVHISTGATGNTPPGRWQVYRRVTGWDWVLYYPTYFLRGFAIHGYPSVPPYPASHGCVRVPLWVAPRLYEMNGYAESVYVY